MEAITIPTSFRCIQLQCDSLDLSEFEKEALDKYSDLHNFIFKVWQGYLSYHNEGIEHQQSLERYAKEVTAFEQEMKRYGDIAGYTKEDMDSVLVTEEYTVNPGILKDDILRFQVEFLAFYEAFKSFVEALQPLEDDYEEFDKLFEEFDQTYFSPIIRNWKNMQIDTVRFDNDYNELKEELPCLEEERNDSIDLYNFLPKEYEVLVARVNKVYKRLEMIFDHFAFVKKMHEGWDEEKSSLN
jgi:hypothetical protein